MICRPIYCGITEWEMYITAQGCRLRSDLYCVEWDVKLYYTTPYRGIVNKTLLLHCAPASCVQCILIGPVCLWVGACGWVCYQKTEHIGPYERKLTIQYIKSGPNKQQYN